MRIIDISWPLSSTMTGYKNKKEFVQEQLRQIGKDGVAESRFIIGSHAGTHIDAPAHMIDKGTNTSEISLSSFIGHAVVLDLTHVTEHITRQDLERAVADSQLAGKIVLCKTKNSFLLSDALFDPDFVYVTQDAARYLVELQVKAVGIDYLGIERSQPGHTTHKILLESSVCIIEGLRLAQVQVAAYYFICLPLAVAADGAPARAILLEG